jgi:hypothetical protein
MSRTYTEQDQQALTEAEIVLHKRGLDLYGAGAQHNGEAVINYFEQNPTVRVTAQNVVAFVNANKQLFKWVSPAESEYRKVAAENPAAASQLDSWMQRQGRPGTVTNTGDEFYSNSAQLLVELRGHQIDHVTLDHAIVRIQSRAGRKLAFVALPRRVDPRQHQDSGKFLEGANKTKQDYLREARERYEPKAEESASSIRGRALTAAKFEAESLKGATHSQTDTLQRIFVMEGTSIDWPKTLEARKAEQRHQQNRNAVSDRCMY